MNGRHPFLEIVSIHTPTKGVTVEDRSNAEERLCFNPHTHEGCDNSGLITNKLTGVSIHTPTKGVTSKTGFVLSSGIFSFNPHTHEGCDMCCLILKLKLISFNPHTHEGCD